MSTLIFGATGSLGHLVLDALAVRGVAESAITAAGRNTASLAAYSARGFDTAQVDISDASQVAEAIDGHDAVVLISGTEPNRLAQHITVIEAAEKAGVAHLYYTSALRAGDPRFPLGEDHKATEDALFASGLRYTILRNGWYIENYAASLSAAEHTGTFPAAVGDSVVAAASRRDFAEALAVTVTSEGHEDKTYSLTGDTDYSYDDIAAAMSAVLGRAVQYTPVSPEALNEILTGAGLDAETADFLVGLDESIATGVLSKDGDDLHRLIDRPTTSLVDALGAAR